MMAWWHDGLVAWWHSGMEVWCVDPNSASNWHYIKSTVAFDCPCSQTCYYFQVMLYYGVIALWFCGYLVLWFCGSVVLWSCGSPVLRFCGSMVLWCYGVTSFH